MGCCLIKVAFKTGLAVVKSHITEHSSPMTPRGTVNKLPRKYRNQLFFKKFNFHYLLQACQYLIMLISCKIRYPYVLSTFFRKSYFVWRFTLKNGICELLSLLPMHKKDLFISLKKSSNFIFSVMQMATNCANMDRVCRLEVGFNKLQSFKISEIFTMLLWNVNN